MATLQLSGLTFVALPQRDHGATTSVSGRSFLLGLCLVLLLAALPGVAHAAPQVIYVDKDAPGPTQDGASWTTAYRTLQTALDVTNANGGMDYEIWMAEGTYYPDEGGGHVDNSRSESFRIVYDNVQLYGGFAGSETARDQRDWTAHPVILNGDIDGDGTLTNDAYHVVVLDGVTNEDITAATVLDGFMITGGNGDGFSTPPDDRGGGVYCNGSESGHLCSPTLSNMLISGNGAYFGGAIYNNGYLGESSPTLKNVTVSGNLAAFGGGIYNNGESGVSRPRLTNVMLTNNSADYGGGMHNNGVSGVSSPVLTYVTVSDNHAEDGGGLYNGGANGVSSPVLTNVTVSGNSASSSGGGMCNFGSGGKSSPVLTNVIISGNRAENGGGMLNYGFFRGESSPVLTNVTLTGNSAAESGGGMYNFGRYYGIANPTLVNSIVWGNEAITGTQIYDYEATPQVIYSNVQGGGYPGTGNIDADPLFVAPVDASSAPTITGDYQLLFGSPSIDAGANTRAPATDIRGLPRPANLVTDMGAYEAQGFTLAIKSGDHQTTAIGAAFGELLTVQISSTDGKPLEPGSVVVFMPPSSGPGLIVTEPFTATPDADGQATVAVTANWIAGSYGVTVTAHGVVTPVVFSLANTTIPVEVRTAMTGTGSGSVTSEPAGIDCGVTCTATFDYSTIVTLTATANSGSTFVNWTEGGAPVSTDAGYTFTATSDRMLVAHFSSIPEGLNHLYLPAVSR